jgi:hypothetical protein
MYEVFAAFLYRSAVDFNITGSETVGFPHNHSRIRAETLDAGALNYPESVFPGNGHISINVSKAQYSDNKNADHSEYQQFSFSLHFSPVFLFFNELIAKK